ncbi:MAG: cytochrome b/b6 domain-containing protein [Bacteroidales bacterium]|nr:cytochrome b/b6 domain-containing protein [Bacteroidales bacterium]
METTSQKATYSIALRIFHWLNATTILFILLTVFTRKEWLEKFKIRDIILDFANRNDLIISTEQAYQLAKLIRNEIWNFHYTLGIFLAILFLYRLILLLTNDGRRVFKEGFSVFRKSKSSKSGIKFMYIVFYIALLISIVTGLMMYFNDFFGITKETKNALEALHVGIVTIVIYFVPLHLIGVVLAELGNEKGIVSKMINGGKENKTQ